MSRQSFDVFKGKKRVEEDICGCAMREIHLIRKGALSAHELLH